MPINLRLSASASGTRNVYDIIKNMVVDYAADNTGVADVTSKYYTSLKTDIQNKKAYVVSPAGSYNFASLSGTSLISNGGKDVFFENTGATWNPSSNLQSDHVGGGIDQVNGQSARINTANIGDTSVSLTTTGLPGGGGSAGAGYISRFSIGNWILVCGWAIQAQWLAPYSFPPNWQFYEYRKITNIIGNTIYFAEPLTQYYSATWPEINRGNAFQVDAAGPATVWALSPNWGGTTTVNGGTYNASQLINCCRENFIITGGTCVNQPVYPSVNKLFRAVNHTATGNTMEHDKLNDLVDIQGGTYGMWKMQSSSTRLAQFSGTTLSSINGTTSAVTFDNCTITGGAILGAISYGRSDSAIFRNCTFGSDIVGGSLDSGALGNGVNEYIRMSGGVITAPICLGDYLTRFAPKADGSHVLFWSGDSGPIGPFKILSATADTWPAVDDQTSTTNVSITSGAKTLTVSSSIFVSGDVNKCIIVPGAGGGGADLRTMITAFNSATSVTLLNAAGTTLSASSKTIQWGTCNTYFTTDQAGGFPNSAFYPSGKLKIYAPAVRSLRLENCTGTAQILDLSQPAAWDKPLHAYTKRTYDGSTGATGAPSIQLIGNLVSLKVNVTKAYTGVGTLTMGFSQFDNMSVVASGATNYSSYGPRFNLKATGERVITVGSTTGAQTGDTNLNISTATWFLKTYQASMSRDISGESSSDWPSFTVEFILDQGF